MKSFESDVMKGSPEAVFAPQHISELKESIRSSLDFGKKYDFPLFKGELAFGKTKIMGLTEKRRLGYWRPDESTRLIAY